MLGYLSQQGPSVRFGIRYLEPLIERIRAIVEDLVRFF